MYEESELIDGLRKRDHNVMRTMYEYYFPMIEDLVCRNGGNREDAADVFQEGMVVTYEKVCSAKFVWSSTLKTYLFAVCRNKWLMELRRRRSKGTDVLSDVTIADEGSIEKDVLRSERNALMRKHFANLGENCQKVMTLFFKKFSLREIALKMGFSEAYAKKRKFVCQQKLIALIADDPIYKELKE